MVLKFDVDFGSGSQESSIEWGFLADLLYSPRHLALGERRRGEKASVCLCVHIMFGVCGKSGVEHCIYRRITLLN